MKRNKIHMSHRRVKEKKKRFKEKSLKNVYMKLTKPKTLFYFKFEECFGALLKLQEFSCKLSEKHISQ